MLDWSFIRQCHAHVPVLYWPVLWVSLMRLAATIAVYREEGRRCGCVRVTLTGQIWFDFLDESDAEREARASRVPDFDRAPWERLALGDEIAPGLGQGEPVSLAGAQLAWDYPAIRLAIHPLWPPWGGGFFLNLFSAAAGPGDSGAAGAAPCRFILRQAQDEVGLC